MASKKRKCRCQPKPKTQPGEHQCPKAQELAAKAKQPPPEPGTMQGIREGVASYDDGLLPDGTPLKSEFPPYLRQALAAPTVPNPTAVYTIDPKIIQDSLESLRRILASHEQTRREAPAPDPAPPPWLDADMQASCVPAQPAEAQPQTWATPEQVDAKCANLPKDGDSWGAAARDVLMMAAIGAALLYVAPYYLGWAHGAMDNMFWAIVQHHV